jgi:ribose/xylose/arabinose/galactoside ABC-type transport system permease subunit
LTAIEKSAEERLTGGRILIGIVRNRVLFLIVLMVLLSLFAGIAYDTFFTSDNLKAVFLNIAIDAIVSVGMMILLVSGMFDLTVGSVLGFTGAITALCLDKLGLHPGIAALIGIISGMCVGAFNGMIVAKVGVNHLIMGLAMLGVVRGIVLLMIGSGIHRLPEQFLLISDASFMGLRLPIWYMVVVAVFFAVLLRKTVFFRRYYYIGGNEKAASFSGISVPKMRIISFIISGGLAGVSGVILTAKLAASIPTLGMGLELRSITACILGGASLAGGYGTILGSFLGVLFMGLVNNLMIVSRVAISWQSIVVSGILLIAVTIDALLKQSER